MQTTWRLCGEAVQIKDFNSAGAQAIAKQIGATECRFIFDNGAQGDAMISVWEMVGADGTPHIFAETNADPIWEDEDPQAFADLMQTMDVSA